MKREYIISRYTYLFETTKGVFLAYSSKNNSFIKLSKELFDILHNSDNSNLNISDIPDEVIQTLVHNGILCTELEDDEYVVRNQFITQSVQHDKSRLNLIIAPTLNCNFNCPYCFENDKRASTMSDSTINDLIDFIKSFEGVKEMSLTWYGGEPLLALPTIEKILTRITGEVGISIKNHTIITNGYLFTDKAIKVFEKFPLDSIQITLDGTADRHNKLRALKGNNYPTYDKIVSNIGNILKQLANVTLHLRVNIDKTNVDDYFEIHKSFTNTFNNPNLIVYPDIIRLENEERTNIVEPAFGRWETANLLYELYSKGFLGGEIYPVQRRAKTCCAMCVNSFIIGPMGEIYKCWNDVSDRTRIIGHIKNSNISNSRLYFRYHQSCAWYNDPVCRECFFLPICNGKCAWYNERNLYHNGNYNLCQCLQKAPGLLEKCLEHYYEHYKKV